MLKDYYRLIKSPLRAPRISIYFGKIAIGTPYFLPRKMVKSPDGKSLTYKPIKWFGINKTKLGWKTKFEDFRFEYPPSLSIVLFGKQLFITLVYKNKHNCGDSLGSQVYWEGYVNYLYNTDKTKPISDRFIELVEKYTCTWTGVDGSTDYYPLILKNKWAKAYNVVNSHDKGE